MGRVEGVELLKDLIRIALVRVVVGQAPEAGEQLLGEQLLLREHVEDIFGLQSISDRNFCLGYYSVCFHPHS